ncbi:MAG TPA: thioredoxin family protein [Halanaerobiales bacterium]|nr:thioredoxin family protein [Halanaerobiales bacterium]
MKKIEVLGSGCPKCKRTAKLIKKEIENAGIEAEVLKVEDLDEIVNRGIMLTPAVMVDGELKCEGKVPAAKEIKSWFV